MTDATNPQSPDAAATPPVTPPTPAPASAQPAAPGATPTAAAPAPTAAAACAVSHGMRPAPPAYGATTGAPMQPAPGAPPVYGAAAPYYGAPAPKTNVLAIISMIAAILGFVWILPFIGSLGGAIMGHISLNQIKKTGEGGRGMALAGVIVGWIGVAIAVIGIAFFLFFVILGATAGTRYSSY
ncbi:DUF4190 domain-containing protein [Microbacterium hominis]|uniref:DUF4190 domain-containing protein n=1 Tax=Microbacterium hominis TaxID=162426 RepID=UPI0007688D8B|nr:DUF4190 domain-containing protein [Microbacterium hominis]KXC06884.1 hypothetical protein MhomT_02425 [Microbacterium hominis]